MTQVPALLALWLAGQVASGGELRGLGGEVLHVTADVARREGSTHLVSYEGGAVLRSESVQVRADTLTYDESARRVEARGHAMLVAGEFVAVADALTLDIPAEQVTVTDGLVLQKRGVSPAALRDARTRDELLRLGENALALRGARIQRLGPGRFRVSDVSLIPCDCDPNAPAWRIRASEADVVAGESATLRGWQVMVGNVPVLPPFPVPWTEVPLSDRRSGLLFPGITFSGPSGFGFEQPIFWAPHPSYDFTFTPGYSFGLGGAKEEIDSPVGVRGPRLLTEFRYAPVAGTEGRASLGLVYDLRLQRDPITLAAIAGTRRQLRGNLSLDHAQDFGNGLSLRANLGLVSDGAYVKDQNADVLGRQAEYTRSTVAFSHRGEDHYLGLDAVLRQDLRTAHRFFQSNVGGAVPPSPLHRLPGFTFALPERQLAGPVFGGLTLSYARLASLSGDGGDEGADGVLNGFDAPDAGQLNGVYDAGERERRDRLDLMPRLSASLPVGDVLQLTPSVAWRQTAYYGETTGASATRGYPLLQAAAESRLARTFGNPGSGLTHVVTPRIVGLWVPFVTGNAPGAYDALDTPFGLGNGAVAPPGQLFQAVAEVQQRLVARGGGGAQEVLRLDIGQGFDLLPEERFGNVRIAEAYARLTGRVGPFSGSGGLRVDPLTRSFNQTFAALALDLGSLAGVSITYDAFLAGGSERMRMGIDALVGPPLPVPNPSGLAEAKPGEQVRVQARWATPLRGLGLSADVLVEPKFVIQRDSTEIQKPLASAVLGISFAPAPNCWSLGLQVGATRPQAHEDTRLLEPRFGLNFTISNFGSFGTQL